jgi:hypothetical protein
VKSITMSLALIAMVVFGNILAGPTVDLAILPIFSAFGTIGTIFAVLLFKNIKDT